MDTQSRKIGLYPDISDLYKGSICTTAEVNAFRRDSTEDKMNQLSMSASVSGVDSTSGFWSQRQSTASFSQSFDSALNVHLASTHLSEDASIYGPIGTREASVNWFKATQAQSLIESATARGLYAEWFHGIISRKESERLLQNRPVGCFLVRVGESRLGYSLSFRDETKCRHYMIDFIEYEQHYQVTGEPFKHASLSHLVKYHQQNRLQNWPGLLTQPCPQEEGACDYKDLIVTQQDERMLDYLWRRPRIEATAPDYVRNSTGWAQNQSIFPVAPQHNGPSFESINSNNNVSSTSNILNPTPVNVVRARPTSNAPTAAHPLRIPPAGIFNSSNAVKSSPNLYTPAPKALNTSSDDEQIIASIIAEQAFALAQNRRRMEVSAQTDAPNAVSREYYAEINTSETQNLAQTTQTSARGAQSYSEIATNAHANAPVAHNTAQNAHADASIARLTAHDSTAQSSFTNSQFSVADQESESNRWNQSAGSAPNILLSSTNFEKSQNLMPVKRSEAPFVQQSALTSTSNSWNEVTGSSAEFRSYPQQSFESNFDPSTKSPGQNASESESNSKRFPTANLVTDEPKSNLQFYENGSVTLPRRRIAPPVPESTGADKSAMALDLSNLMDVLRKNKRTKQVDQPPVGLNARFIDSTGVQESTSLNTAFNTDSPNQKQYQTQQQNFGQQKKQNQSQTNESSQTEYPSKTFIQRTKLLPKRNPAAGYNVTTPSTENKEVLATTITTEASKPSQNQPQQKRIFSALMNSLSSSMNLSSGKRAAEKQQTANADNPTYANSRANRPLPPIPNNTDDSTYYAPHSTRDGDIYYVTDDDTTYGSGSNASSDNLGEPSQMNFEITSDYGNSSEFDGIETPPPLPARSRH